MTSWIKQKSLFSHGWLQNALPTRISAVQASLRTAMHSREALQQLRVLCDEWNRNRAWARTIIDEYEDAVSPRQYFSVPPLAALDREISQPLAQLVHESWLYRHRVRIRLEAASRALAETDLCVAAIKELLDGGCADLSPMHVDELLTDLKKSVLQCATSMNELPREGTL